MKLKDYYIPEAKETLVYLGSYWWLNVIAISKVVLCASLPPVPKQFIDKLNKMTSKFSWGMRFKVSRKKCS